jgi:hypothetical protein
MAISVAAIRAAAGTIRSQSQRAGSTAAEPVSRFALSRHLGVHVGEINRYLVGIAGLADEIGASMGFTNAQSIYREAAEAIVGKGEIPTYTLLVEYTGKTDSIVRNFCNNNPDFVEKYRIAKHGVAKGRKAYIKLREAVYGDRPVGTQIIIADIAEAQHLTTAGFLLACRRVGNDVDELVRELNARNFREKYRLFLINN